MLNSFHRTTYPSLCLTNCLWLIPHLLPYLASYCASNSLILYFDHQLWTLVDSRALHHDEKSIKKKWNTLKKIENMKRKTVVWNILFNWKIIRQFIFLTHTKVINTGLCFQKEIIFFHEYVVYIESSTN